jgi:hypothetical protein
MPRRKGFQIERINPTKFQNLYNETMVNSSTENYQKYKEQLFYLLLFLLFALILYFPTIFADPFWDDWVFIFKSDRYQFDFPTPLNFFPGGLYPKSWPIFYTFIWSLLKIFKDYYLGFHLTAIVLHALNSFICYLLLEKWNYKNSVLGGFLFLVHPAHLFTISWIIQLKTSLCIFFFLISLFFLERLAKKFSLKHFLALLFFFLLSIFSKTTTVASVVCLFFSYPFLKNKISLRRYLLIFIIPIFIFSSVAVVRTALNFNIEEFKNASLMLEENSYSPIYFFSKEAKTSIIDRTHESFLIPEVTERILLSLKSIQRYTIFSIFPIKSDLFFQDNTTLDYSSFELFSISLFLFILIFIFRWLKSNQNIPGFMGLVFYVSAILPFCGIVYIPLFGASNFVPYWLTIPLLGLIPLALTCFRDQRVLLAIIFTFAIITHSKTYDLINTEQVFINSIKNSPGIMSFKEALVEHFIFKGQCEKARDAYTVYFVNNNLNFTTLNKKVMTCRKN